MHLLSNNKVLLLLPRTIFFLALIVLCACTAQAQRVRTLNPNDSISADKSSPDSPSHSTLSSPEEEMMARREIKFREKARQENLDRAHEAAQLGAQLHDAYVKNSSLSREDWKKLERLEKLTRRVRSEVGGADDEAAQERETPHQIDDALARIAALSEEMSKGVEKTPRQVISMPLIEKTNELLGVIRFVRNTTTH